MGLENTPEFNEAGDLRDPNEDALQKQHRNYLTRTLQTVEAGFLMALDYMSNLFHRTEIKPDPRLQDPDAGIISYDEFRGKQRRKCRYRN